MSRKTIVSISLVVLGVGTSFLVILAYGMSGGKTIITLAFLAAAVACIIVGSILAFSQLLDRFVNPVVDEIHNDIEDDIQDLRQHRITNTIWMVIIIGIGFLVFSFFTFRFHKVEAVWGSIPVVLPTFAGMIALAWFIPRTRWFQGHDVYTPMWIFLIPTVGFICTIAVGVTKTENLGLLRAGRQESIEYNSYRYTGFILQEAAGAGDWGLQLEVPDCDGEDCAVMLVVGLVILTLILVAGSALIPHFWLFSGAILLSIMTLIAIHDLRIRRVLAEELSEEKHPRRHKRPSS